MRKEEDLYSVTVICTNCRYRKKLYLKKGLEVKEYLEKVKGKKQALCPKCKCERLEEIKYGYG